MIRAVWHLAINNLAGRRGRAILLVLAVALATSLVVAVSVSIDTIAASVRLASGQITGLADARIRHRFGGRLDQATLEAIAAWPETAVASARFETGISLSFDKADQRATVVAEGVDPLTHAKIYPMKLAAGRPLVSTGETVIDGRLARRLGNPTLGDELRVMRFGDPIVFTIVGILDRPVLDVLQRPTAYIALRQAQQLAGHDNVLDQIDVRFKPGVNLEQIQATRAAQLPEAAIIETPAAASTGVNRAIRTARLLLLLIAAQVYLSAGFIIFTSLTTAVTQRLRELAVLRCVGAGRAQLFLAQLLSGAMLAGGGAILGAPLGIVLANWLYEQRADALISGLVVTPMTLITAIIAATLAGLIAAIYPAVLAATASPLAVMATRARQPKSALLVLCALAGLALVAAHPVAMLLGLDGQLAVRSFLWAGLPAVFLGYFLLGVPVVIVLTLVTAPLLGRLLRVPVDLLRQNVLATPYRHGFVGGALMVGLAALIVIWTVGRSITDSYLGNVKMPDAFVHSFNALSAEQLRSLSYIDAVTETCPTMMFPVDPRDTQFGLRGLSPENTQFVATDIAAFTHMTDIVWIQGDRETALEKARLGRTLLVSKEYLVAHGVGVGDTINLPTLYGPVDFEVVGVVSSPGLDVAVHFYGIQRAYADASISCVFGTMEDARRYFGIDSVNLVLLSLDPAVDDDEAITQIRAGVPGVVAGSSRAILRHVRAWAAGVMSVGSSVALASLLIACAGVGNLIAANIASRRFEYGVLRAVGAGPGMLCRLLIAETLIVALVGCVVGVGLGLHLSLTAQVFHRQLLGLEYSPVLPWDVIGYGCLIVIGIALLAATPAMLWRRGGLLTPPRMLLAATSAG